MIAEFPVSLKSESGVNTTLTEVEVIAVKEEMVTIPKGYDLTCTLEVELLEIGLYPSALNASIQAWIYYVIEYPNYEMKSSISTKQ